MIDEAHDIKPTELYGHTIFNTTTKKIDGFTKPDNIYNSYNFDPIVFALNVDPLTKKFPNESPYIAMGDNPILNIDPDGAEKVVATGGLDNHNKTTMNFINGTKVILKKYVEQVKLANNNETVSWVIFDFDYSPTQKKEFAAWAKANGVAPPIYVKTVTNLVDYFPALVGVPISSKNAA